LSLAVATCGGDPPAPTEAEAGWGQAQAIGPPAWTYGARVAVTPAASGEAMAVWVQLEGPAPTLWASRFEGGRGWAAPQSLGTPGSTGYDVAADASGTFLVAWVQAVEGRVTVFARRFEPAAGWTPAQPLRSGDSRPIDLLASRPALACAPDGRAVVAWRQVTPRDVEIRAARFAPGAGWQDPELVASTTGNASPADVTLDAGGTALATWLELEDGVTRVRVSRSGSAGWTAGESIDSRPASGDMSHAPLVTATPGGDGFVVYPGSAAFRTNREDLWAARYESGRGWQPPVQIASGLPGAAVQPALAADGRGNAHVVWLDGSLSGVWSNHYTAGAGWGAPRRLDGGSAQVLTPAVAAGPGGEAFAVWAQAPAGGPTYRVWSARFSAAAGWASAVVINADQHAQAPDVGVDGRGNAVAVWAQGPYQQEAAWANRFLAAPGP
jgi:hypothetical protein